MIKDANNAYDANNGHQAASSKNQTSSCALYASGIQLTRRQRRQLERLRPSRTKTRQNESPAERNPIRTTTRQKESPTERKAQFEPVYNKLCVGTVFAASGNVTTET